MSKTQQTAFSTYYKDMDVTCECRFKTKEAMDKIAYYNPMDWSTKAEPYDNGIREFVQKTPSKKEPLRLRNGERVVSLDGRSGTSILDLGAKTYGPQYIIEMDETSEHLPFSRESLVSLDVLEKKARGEIKLSLSLDDTKDCLKVAVADKRNVTKDKSKGNHVRISVDNASLKTASGKPAKRKDLVCDIGKSLMLRGMDSSKTKSIGVARVELWCAGRGGSKKLVGGAAIVILSKERAPMRSGCPSTTTTMFLQLNSSRKMTMRMMMPLSRQRRSRSGRASRALVFSIATK